MSDRQIVQAHWDAVHDICKEKGWLDKKGRLRTFIATEFYVALNERGHTAFGIDRCDCIRKAR